MSQGTVLKMKIAIQHKRNFKTHASLFQKFENLVLVINESITCRIWCVSYQLVKGCSSYKYADLMVVVTINKNQVVCGEANKTKISYMIIV